MFKNKSLFMDGVGRVRCLLPLGLLVSLTACTVGPQYHPQQADMPAEFSALSPALPGSATASPMAAVTMQSDPDPQWWTAFGDPLLNQLIEQSLSGSLTLQSAAYRVMIARTQTQALRGKDLPSVNFQAGVTRQQLGAEGLAKSAGLEQKLASAGGAIGQQGPQVLHALEAPMTLFQTGFDASWELDFFGKNRRAIEAGDAQVLQAVESRNDALVSLQAEVVRQYLTLRGTQAMLASLDDLIKIGQDAVDLTQSRAKNGLESETAVDSAQVQLSGLLAQRPDLLQQQHMALNALALLVGQQPGSLDKLLLKAAPLPALPNVVAVGLPSTLARRRPDIRRAEATIAQATANVGVSVAQLYPSVSLTGQVGLRGLTASSLTDWASHFYTFGPSISIPIFEGGQLRANVHIAELNVQQSVLDYRQTVLSALQDVDNALAAFQSGQEKTRALQQTVDVSERSLQLAKNAYGHGLVSFLDLLDAQRQREQAVQQETQARTQSAINLVSVYKALGGGWENQPVASTDAAHAVQSGSR